MLASPNRLKKKKDFDTTFKNSKVFKNIFFIFRIAKNNLGVNRVGIVVSQKVSKKAVERNKIRRIISEIMAKEIKKIQTGVDIIIVALQQVLREDQSQIKKEVENLLIRSGIIKNV